MRALSLAMIAIVFAITACTDVGGPIATGPDAATLTGASPGAISAGRMGAPNIFGGKGLDVRGKRGHDDDDQQACGDDDDDRGKGNHHDRHHEGKRGHHDSRWEKRGHDDHHRGKRGDEDKQTEDCGGGSGGTGGDTTATISGTVMGDGAGLNSFPVFLLDAGGTAVVASTTTTTDGTGSYSFTVKPGTYLVCEDNPFVAAHGFLGETQPSGGAPCPSAYGPRGFALTVAGGATAAGNNFTNFTLE